MVFVFSVSVDNLDEVLEQTDLAAELVESTISEKLAKIVELIIIEAKSNLQNNRAIVSGDLMNSLKVFDEGKYTIEFGSDKDYAFWVEYGRGPVFPVNKKVLHWVDPETGKDVFARYSGPTTGIHFMESAMLKYMPMLGEFLKDMNPQE